MKARISITCIMLFISVMTIGAKEEQQASSTSQRPPTPIIVMQQPPEDFDPTPLVLQSFGGMIGNFLDILVNPDDPQHVVNCVSDMIQGMVNIHTVGMRRGATDTQTLYEQLQQELIAFLTTIEGKTFLDNWKATFVQKTRAFTVTV